MGRPSPRPWQFISAPLLFLFFTAGHVSAQTPPPTPPQPQAESNQASMPGMVMAANPAGDFMMRQASGTGVNPASSPMEMKMWQRGSWNFMFHAQAFLADIQQSGPRGGDKLFSTNWFMGMAQHPLGKGSLMIRAMVSLEPATITERRYPLLFQTGETAYGRPLVDGQHPHDLFMELAVEYARPLNDKTMLTLYAAPVGDPALGPVAFPHRVSAAELPQATLAHHLQDSTHISDEVFTVGVSRNLFRFETSAFHGGEPNENRWNIDHGAVDSWATRFTLTPNANWVAQISVGRIHHPEALEPGDVVRSTASITYNRPLGAGHWASSLIWGRNHKTANRSNQNSYLAESVLQFKTRNYLTGRIELVDKDELFNDQPALQQRLAETVGSVFRVQAYTFGYTRDFKFIPGVIAGLGGNFTAYAIPPAIQPYYGSHPTGFLLFLRFRLKGDEMMPSMKMP